MTARRDLWQQLGRERLYEAGQTQPDGSIHHAPRSDQRQFGSFPAPGGAAAPQVGLVRTALDDIHIVPGYFVAQRASAFGERIAAHGAQIVEETPYGEDVDIVRVSFGETFELREGDTETTKSYRLLQQLLTANDEFQSTAPAAQEFAPLYGFVAHQTTHPTDDPEKAPTRDYEPEGLEGTGVRVVVIDTGIWADWQWRHPARQGALSTTTAPAVADEDDPLFSDRSGRLHAPGVRNHRRKYLGRAAGHGTFIGGIIRQVVPAAEITFLRAADTDGLVDEWSFAERLQRAMAVKPDIVVICCGGTMYRRGGDPKDRDISRNQDGVWLRPLLLEAALGALLHTDSKPLVVMSAGNDGSSDYCYPAAFADPRSTAFQAEKEQLVSVAALDDQDWLAFFSNYGGWVTASALGVRLESTFVAGHEDPDDDPDGHAETWPGTRPWAMWSGTSFAAPVVAGMAARTLWALRQADPATPPSAAWALLQQQSAPGPSGPSTGVVVSAPMVDHA